MTRRDPETPLLRRLADRRWHSVLVYRIVDHGELSGAPPAPQTGCYVEEVLSTGAALAPWRF